MLSDEQIEDLLEVGNPTDEEKRLIRLGWDAARNAQPVQAQAGAVPRYRLLVRGQDTIQADDEFLREDGATWLKDPSGIFVGCMYEGTIFLPARRAIDEAHGIEGGQHGLVQGTCGDSEMTKKQMLDLMRLLSALESWAMSRSERLPGAKVVGGHSSTNSQELHMPALTCPSACISRTTGPAASPAIQASAARRAWASPSDSAS